MNNTNLKKKIAFALIPLLGLCLVVFISAAPKVISNSINQESYLPTYQNEYATEEQKPEVPSHEPVYISIFKFIVNCNPFKKETQQ